MIYTALITPFDSRGEVDFEGLRFHIKRQQEAEVDGLVLLGTTGESPTLSLQEKERLIAVAYEESRGLPLMVGCGTYSTSQTLENIQKAAEQGASSALVITPFYNRPTQMGMVQHFETLCKASPIPLVVYNNPGRTGVHIEVETLKRLSDFPQIIGIKECSGSIFHFCDLLRTVKQERPTFSIFTGDDNMLYPTLAMGGDGVISSLANLIPKKIKALMSACENKDFFTAQKLNLSLVPLFKALFMESNPIPLKAALNLCGLPAGSPRLPLTPLDPKYMPHLQHVLDEGEYGQA